MTLIPNWREWWKMWSIQLAAFGVILPEVLQYIADNSATLLPWFDDGTKGTIRMYALLGVMIVRLLQQASVKGTPPPSDPTKGIS